MSTALQLQSITPQPAVAVAAARSALGSGKAILAGELASTYGFPTLAIGLERGVTARIIPDARCSQLHLRGVGTVVRETDHSDLGRAFAAILTATRRRRSIKGAEPPPIEVELFSSLPIASGLGSSAAIGVALARVMAPRASEQEMLSYALAWERSFNSDPELDILVAARGGCLVAARNETPTTIVIRDEAYLCIGLSGRTRSPRAVTASIAERRQAYPSDVSSAFEAIGGIARRMSDALRAGQLDRVGHLMTANHHLLRRLQASTICLDRICELATEAGALGAKLTGGGGGGAAIALAASATDAEKVLEAWRSELFPGFVVSIGSRAPAASAVHSF